jgi:SAM-dependent methyltransferase
MKALDIYLQNVRFKKARKFIRKNDSILDIGADDGVMFDKYGSLISSSVGIEPVLSSPVQKGQHQLLPGYFPDACPPERKYDIITMLAVLEHIPTEVQKNLAHDCSRFLKPGGRIVITVPSPQVDMILDVLGKLKLIDGMQLHEHYGFKPKDTFDIFNIPDLKLLHHSTFQFGLNNLFVFEKK